MGADNVEPGASPDTALLQHIAETVRHRREALGMTRKRLGQVTGISERFLADIEAGRANPSILRLATIARELECSLPELIAANPAPPHTPHRRNRIALLGLRGAGKSSVGRALADALGSRFVELDEEIEDQTGLPIGQIFTLHGESYYRSSERACLEALDDEESIVLATGGGLVTEHETFARLRSSFHTIWLKAEPKDHWERVVAQGDTRPMAGHARAFAELCSILLERESLYDQASWTVETSGRAVTQILEEILQRLRTS